MDPCPETSRHLKQTTGTNRQTWTLDPALRFRAWTTETGTAGTWTQTGSKLNHYDGDSDNPRWTVENTSTGELTRNVDAPTGDLGAVTGQTGSVVLQFTNLHGDVAIALPLDAGQAPRVFDADEYGNPKTALIGRYGWLGAKQRSAETPSGNILMGVRLYDPMTGRFLSVDPVAGGNANAYEYVHADPLTNFDLDGRKCWKWAKKACGAAKSVGNHFRNNWRTYATVTIAVAGVAAAGACGLSIVCGVAVAGAAGFATYSASHAGRRSWSWWGAAKATGLGAAMGFMNARGQQGARSYASSRAGRRLTTKVGFFRQVGGIARWSVKGKWNWWKR